jgi:hypothetical protein
MYPDHVRLTRSDFFAGNSTRAEDFSYTECTISFVYFNLSSC